MLSSRISDAELEPFIGILLVKRPAYRELSSDFIDVKVQIGKSYRYRISVLNDGGKTKKYEVESKDSHVISLCTSKFTLHPGMSKSFFITLTPIGSASLKIKINDKTIPIQIAV